MALESSAEQPLPVRTVAQAIAGWVAKLGRIWVEGQVTQVSRRPGAGTVFLTLRDPAADMSLSVTCARGRYDELQPPLVEGARVVVWAQPSFWPGRGTLSLQAHEIRPVGVGELLARLERLKAIFATEGLFAADRKKRLPFLPTVVGLVTGRASAAERDVVENTRRRWPSVRFEIREVAVQGPGAASAVVDAIHELDAMADVEVIVLARGGGSVEDLLAFSDEGLCRAVARCRTPVVSAIGHETDTPLVDFIADVRASTPTDAAKRIVPEVGEELARVSRARDALHRLLWLRIDREQTWLDTTRSRPALGRPGLVLDRHAAELTALTARAHHALLRRLDTAAADVTHSRARLRSLSPQATLDRGYAVVQTMTAESQLVVVRSPGAVSSGDVLEVRVAGGRLTATVGPG